VRVLAPLRRGRLDPSHQVVGERVVWRTARLSSGPVVARLHQTGATTIECDAWGAGGEQFVAELPVLLGEGDELADFDPAGHRLVAKLHAASPWLRMPRTNLVFEALTSAILEQRVTYTEALAGRLHLHRRYGESPPAAPPGMPAGMLLAPTPAAWRGISSPSWHRAGVDVHRALTIARCAEVAARLDETAAMGRLEGMRRMRAVPGVGVWTVAETRQRALGDPDSVSYGDTHLARFVGYALTGAGVDDHGMEELLEPWRGHRHRVVRLLQLGVAHGVVPTAPSIAKAPPRRHLRY